MTTGRISIRVRTFLTLAAGAALLSLAVTVLWRQNWRYSLPVPRPAGLEQPEFGAVPVTPAALVDTRHSASKPLFVRFFNPACPCSRFNLSHLRVLLKTHGGRVEFIAVLEGETSADALQQELASLGVSIPAIADSWGAIVGALGVYATPEAAVLEAGGRLFYRGNYNRVRYYAIPSSEYARIALEALLAGQPRPLYRDEAAVAWGCPLPHHSSPARMSV
jgi:hypothetical protein